MKIYAVFKYDVEYSSFIAAFSNSNFAKNWVKNKVEEFLKQEKEQYNQHKDEINLSWEDWIEDLLYYEGYGIKSLELDNPNFKSEFIYHSNKDYE